MNAVEIAYLIVFALWCGMEFVSRHRVQRKVEAARAAQRADREAREIAWAVAHPDLASRGVPAPPSARDMLVYEVRG